MKKHFLILIAILITSNVWAQYNRAITKYFILSDSLQISKITSTYKDAELELYNVFLDKNKKSFLLFGVLPDVVSQKIVWHKINLDEVKQKMISVEQIKERIYQAIEKIDNKSKINFGEALKVNDIYPLIKKGKDYYTPANAVMEYFSDKTTTHPAVVIDNIFADAQRFYQINTNAKILTINDFESQYLKYIHKYSFNYHGTADNYPVTANMPFQYLLIKAQDTVLADKPAYRFWFLGEYSSDGNHIERGAERFTYIPKIGIVAGCYDAYWFNHIKLNVQETFNSKQTSNKIDYNYLHNIQSTPLRIEVNGKLMYEKK